MRVLPLIRSLLDELHASDISYCHWKSNFHLERALLGQADLDLLVDPAHRPDFEARLRGLRFVPLIHTGPKRISGLEDFLGFDETTGALVHLHVHYRLVLGEQRVKNHHLPLEPWLLSNARIRDGVRVPRVEDELFLLYVRSLIKSDTRACARAWLRRAPHPFPASIHAELIWLAEQTRDDAVLEACRGSGLGILAEDLGDFLGRLRSARLTPAYVLKQKRVLLHQLRPYQRYPTAICWARKAWFRARYSRPARFLCGLPKKRLVGRGLYAAIAGADGSGKTTLAADLPAWLGCKLQSSTVYFGQPKGSPIVKGLRKARKLILRTAPFFEKTGLRPVARVFAGCGRLVNSALWLYIAYHRRRLDSRVRKRVLGGQVVFAERFPVPGFWDMDVPMDGPRLRPQASDGALLRRLAVLERALYEDIATPDCVIVLSASLPTLRQRKPGTPIEELRAKARAVATLVDRGGYDVIDAEQPYEQVVLEAKRRIWRLLSPSAAPEVLERRTDGPAAVLYR